MDEEIQWHESCSASVWLAPPIIFSSGASFIFSLLLLIFYQMGNILGEWVGGWRKLHPRCTLLSLGFHDNGRPPLLLSHETFSPLYPFFKDEETLWRFQQGEKRKKNQHLINLLLPPTMKRGAPSARGANAEGDGRMWEETRRRTSRTHKKKEREENKRVKGDGHPLCDLPPQHGTINHIYNWIRS